MTTNNKNNLIFLILLLATGLGSGCASSGTQKANGDPDPLEPANRVFYNVNEGLDRFLLKPVAKGYAKVTPNLVRSSVTNFFANLSYLNVIVNDILQGKIDQGLSDMSRMLFNSTIGIGGLFDVSTGLGLPEHNEDFGQTLAVWGTAQGAYLYFPVVRGPSTVRDSPDIATSTLLNPITYVTNTIAFPLTALNIINIRANLLDETSIRDEAALDPYAFTREAYLQRREYLIYDGNPPTEEYDEIFEDLPEDDLFSDTE